MKNVRSWIHCAGPPAAAGQRLDGKRVMISRTAHKYSYSIPDSSSLGDDRDLERDY